MKQVTIRQLVRQGSKAKLEEWMPCEIVSDGEVIGILYGVRQTMGASMPSVFIPAKSDKLTELPLAKTKQAKHMW